MTLMERYSKTAPEFQDYVASLATRHNKAIEQVYSWWREYCDACQNYDQSPVQFEFENWYSSSLNA